MKGSHIAVLSALGLLLVLIFVVSGTIFVAPASAHDENVSGAKEKQSETMELKDFDRVEIGGMWTVQIIQSESFSVELSYPKMYENRLLVEVDGSTLLLDYKGDNISFQDKEESSAIVRMPSLVQLGIEGIADVRIEGFDENRMQIDVEGASEVMAYSSTVDTLKVALEGVGNVNLEGLVSVDAEVHLEGLGQINLSMAGGILEGSLEGLGTIVYGGAVREENIEVDGLGSVKYRKQL